MTEFSRADTADFGTIFSKDLPMLDLRAPVEFIQGAFPSAINLPLMLDEERKKVGIRYKQNGQDSAIKLGNKLVAGKIREARMASWKNFIKQHPEGYLYCFRGGLRSRTVQQWLLADGFEYPLIQGGYKAMRQFLISTLDTLSQSLNFMIIGGRTGTRKTELIIAAKNAVDLEGRANHRGSSFGRRVSGQPTVINFENNVAIDLLKLSSKYSTILLEDEGVTIGNCSVPEPLRRQIKTSPLYLVEASIDERIENILQDYVLTLCDEYSAFDPNEGLKNYQDAMFSSLIRIKKRLGGERYKRFYQLMGKAFNSNNISESRGFHCDWIKGLIVEYYDPMYDFQLAKKQHRVQGQGSWNSIAQQLKI